MSKPKSGVYLEVMVERGQRALNAMGLDNERRQ
jgi:hypothetical protein